MHASIPAAVRSVEHLGYRTRVLAGADQLTAARLAGAKAVVFLNTSGELGAAPRRRLLAWVRDGGAFVGAHAAADTLASSRAFDDMLGADFAGPRAAGRAPRADRRPTAPSRTQRSFAIREEFYAFRGRTRAPRDRAAPRRRRAGVDPALRARARVLRRARALRRARGAERAASGGSWPTGCAGPRVEAEQAPPERGERWRAATARRGPRPPGTASGPRGRARSRHSGSPSGGVMVTYCARRGAAPPLPSVPWGSIASKTIEIPGARGHRRRLVALEVDVPHGRAGVARAPARAVAEELGHAAKATGARGCVGQRDDALEVSCPPARPGRGPSGSASRALRVG